MNNTPEKNFYSVSEAAEILGISRVAVHKKIKTGEIKGDKIGSVFIIPKESLLPHIKELPSAFRKKEVDEAVKKAVFEYRETFKLLGKE